MSEAERSWQPGIARGIVTARREGRLLVLDTRTGLERAIRLSPRARVTGEVDSGPTQIKVGDSVAVAGPELTSNGLLIANTIDLGVVKIRGYIENSFKDGWIVNDNGAIRSLTLDRRNPPVDGHGAPLNIDLLRALFIAGRHVHVLGVPERDGSIRVIRFLIPRDRLTPK